MCANFLMFLVTGSRRRQGSVGLGGGEGLENGGQVAEEKEERRKCVMGDKEIRQRCVER